MKIVCDCENSNIQVTPVINYEFHKTLTGFTIKYNNCGKEVHMYAKVIEEVC